MKNEKSTDTSDGITSFEVMNEPVSQFNFKRKIRLQYMEFLRMKNITVTFEVFEIMRGSFNY